MSLSAVQASRANLSILDTYLRDISGFALLSERSDEDVASLFTAMRGGSKEAKDDLIKGCLPLVVEIANRYRGKGVSLEDLIEQGNLGLFDALDRYDETMQTKFTTYASFWIKCYVLAALKNNARNHLAQIPTDDHSFLDNIPDRKAVDHVGEVLPSEAAQDMEYHFAKLPPRWREIMRSLYYENLSSAEVGKRFRVKRRRINQIREESLRKLRRSISRSEGQSA